VTDGIVSMADMDADAAAELEIPGICYVKLLHQMPAEVFSGRQLYICHAKQQ